MYSQKFTTALFLFRALLAKADSSSTLQQCTTAFGKSSVQPVPSSTVALTLTSRIVIQVVSTPISTITPVRSTSTSSTTVTSTQTSTLPQQTDTYTTTTTNTIPTTFIPSTYTFTTYTDTTTTTTTLPAQTSTVATPAGFVPVASVIPAKRDTIPAVHVPRRAALDIARRAQSATTSIAVRLVNGQVSITPAIYPTKVVCAKLVEVYATSTSTSKAAKTATVTAAPLPPAIATSVFTATATTTTTLVDASTTLTTTTSTYSTTTVVPTTTLATLFTSTVTETPPIQTSYGACAPNNVQQSLNGGYIGGAYYDTAATGTTTDTAYDCCVACITSNCGAYLFMTGDHSCTLLAAAPQGSCSNTVARFIATGTKPIGWYVGQGTCGRIGQAS